MNSWRDQILNEFTPNIARLTLVADPDGLILEEGILEGIRERGFELIPFEDHIAFRYAYESKFRSRWDMGEQTDLVVVLRSEMSDLSTLPYDLLETGRRLSFNLGDIFPSLSYPVVASLDSGDLDTLYDAQQKYAPGQLGDNATKEFILRHVFGIAPELVKTPADLLRVLIRRYYRGQKIPPVLDERFVNLLRQNSTFDEWPLEILTADREAFYTFLQERWPIFLDRMAESSESCVKAAGIPYGLKIDGPVDLPFDHDDIRVYIDKLFMEGLLYSVDHDKSDALGKMWLNFGVRTDPEEDKGRRLNKLIESVETSILNTDNRYDEWMNFARKWAELTTLSYESTAPNDDVKNKIDSLKDQVDTEFTAWIVKKYASLVNLPPVPPVMLHHIPRFLSRKIENNPTAKIALIVVDGLSMDQWLVLRNVIASKNAALHFREHAVFAWIPSTTSVSRQAAFAGKPPIFFPNSIHTTNKEPSLWAQFWGDQGYMANEVIYAKGLGSGSTENVAELISHPNAKVAGLVVDKVDKIMHGMELGTAGMHNQVRQWAQQSYLNSLLELLFEKGFRVFLTSDHGNIEANGCGRPSEGVVAEVRGERVRIYTDALLRSNIHKAFNDTLEWEPIGLPDNYLPLIASKRDAFVNKGKSTVGHGGISIEELIVPLVEIERKNT